MESNEPPCDFDAFVAERYGIREEQARELIRYWLRTYVPRKNSMVSAGELRPSDGSLRAG